MVFFFIKVFPLYRILRSCPRSSWKQSPPPNFRLMEKTVPFTNIPIIWQSEYRLWKSTDLTIFGHEFPYHVPLLLPLCIERK